jgi:hypothetical protein
LSTDIYQIDTSEITARIAQIVAENAPAEAAHVGSKVGPATTSVPGGRLSARQ